MNKESFKGLLKKEYSDKIKCIDEYKNARTKLRFSCEEHGEFIKTPYEVVTLHRGCSKCCGTYGVKKSGYWNSLERCIEEAKKYSNKWELNKKCSGCYRSFLKHKWIDILNEIYKDNIINYGNCEDKVHLIYVYEMKEFNTCYVGRTKNLKRRDKQHRNIIKHSNGHTTCDIIYKFCQEHNIEIPQPIVVESNLNAKESQNKEGYWVNYYKNKKWILLNIAPTGENLSSLGATLKWNYHKCKEESLKYKSKMEFKIKSQSAYNSSVKNKWIDEFYPNSKLINGYWDSLENCICEAKKYKNIKEFAMNGGGAYNAVRRNGFLKEIKDIWKKKL